MRMISRALTTQVKTNQAAKFTKAYRIQIDNNKNTTTSSSTLVKTPGDKDSRVSTAPNNSHQVGPGPLDLNVIHSPGQGRKADIIFVHGLGGTSRWSWPRSKDPELFWPLTFLSSELALCLARISTFGYNVAFHKSGQITTSILDSAKHLLFDMKYGQDQNMDGLDMGSVYSVCCPQHGRPRCEGGTW